MFPDKINFGDVPVGKSMSVSLELANTDSTASKFRIIDNPNSEFINVKVAKTELKPGESTPIEITVGENAPVGLNYTSVTMDVQGKPLSRFSIPIRVRSVDKAAGKEDSTGSKG